MAQPPAATERIYQPRPSALPALVAAGIAFVVIGLFVWWPYAAVGALVALISLIAWLRANHREIARMPRKQRTDTSPIPLSARPGATSAD